jgi:hypothetical protein
LKLNSKNAFSTGCSYSSEGDCRKIFNIIYNL